MSLEVYNYYVLHNKNKMLILQYQKKIIISLKYYLGYYFMSSIYTFTKKTFSQL